MNPAKVVTGALVLAAICVVGLYYKDRIKELFRSEQTVERALMHTVLPNAFGLQHGDPVLLADPTLTDPARGRMVGRVHSASVVENGVEIRIRPIIAVAGAGSSVIVRPGSVTTPAMLLVTQGDSPSGPEDSLWLPSKVEHEVPAGILEPPVRWLDEAALFDAGFDTRLPERAEALKAARGKDPTAAIQWSRRALRHDPGDLGTRLFIADREFRRGRPCAAMEILVIMRNIPESDTRAHLFHAMYGSAAFYAGFYREAADHLETARKLAVERGALRLLGTVEFNLAAAYRRVGEFDRALELLLDAMERDTAADHHDPLLLEADLLFRLNRIDESLAILRNLSARSVLAAVNHGIILQRSDRLPEAIEILSVLADEWPRHAVIRFHLARALEKSQRREAARVNYLAAAEAESDTVLADLYRREASRIEPK